MTNQVDARLGTLFPNLPPQIGDFDRFERLDMMQTDFLPQSWEELRMAFPLWLRQSQSGLTAGQHLDRVYAHQAQPTVNTEHPEAAVQFLTNSMGAFALQAQRDLSALGTLREHFVEDPEPDDSPATMLARMRGIPLFHGPGQLLRGIDVRRIARDHSVDGFVIDPMAGQLKTTISGHIGMVDGYTIQQPPMAITAHYLEVFGEGYLASDGVKVIDQEMENQFNRLGFWNRCLVEAEQNPYAQAAARQFLGRLGLSSEFAQQ